MRSKHHTDKPFKRQKCTTPLPDLRPDFFEPNPKIRRRKIAIPRQKKPSPAAIKLAAEPITILFAGHRGFGANPVQGEREPAQRLPENSLISFQRVIEAGADFIELDVHLSSDNRLMVSHHYLLSANGRYYFDDSAKENEPFPFPKGKDTAIPKEHHADLDIRMLTAQKIQQYFDISQGFSSDDPTIDPELYRKVPLLTEVLQLVSNANQERNINNQPYVKINIELKGQHTGAFVLDEIDQFCQQCPDHHLKDEDLFFLSFLPEEIIDVARQAPSAQVTLGVPTAVIYKSVNERFIIQDSAFNTAKLKTHVLDTHETLKTIPGRNQGLNAVDIFMWDINDDVLRYFTQKNIVIHAAVTPYGKESLHKNCTRPALENIMLIARAQKAMLKESDKGFMLVKTDAPVELKKICNLENNRAQRESSKAYSNVTFFGPRPARKETPAKHIIPLHKKPHEIANK